MLCWLSSSIFSTTSVDGFAKVLSVISSSLMRGMPKSHRNSDGGWPRP
jgi:hypothetical protein